MYEYFYGIGWPDIEFLKMTRSQIKDHEAEVAAELAKENEKKGSKRRGSSKEQDAPKEEKPKGKKAGAKKGKMTIVGTKMPNIDTAMAE